MSRPRNLEIIANFAGQEIVHFTMPGSFQMADQIDPFHAAGKTNVSQMTSAPSSVFGQRAVGVQNHRDGFGKVGSRLDEYDVALWRLHEYSRQLH